MMVANDSSNLAPVPVATGEVARICRDDGGGTVPFNTALMMVSRTDVVLNIEAETFIRNLWLLGPSQVTTPVLVLSDHSPPVKLAKVPDSGWKFPIPSSVAVRSVKLSTRIDAWLALTGS